MHEATLQFIAQHLQDDVRTLALKKAPEGVDLSTALQQIEGRQTALRKLPQWARTDGLWFPPRLSMEQCSSEQTALYKRSLVARLLQTPEDEVNAALRMTDLTGGFGVDFSYLAILFGQATYVERMAHLCDTATHNFEVLNLTQACVKNTDGTEYLQEMEAVDLLYIDPARRDEHGRKTVCLSACEPDVTKLQTQLRKKSRYCVIKLSPILDIQQALQELQGVVEVHVISVEGECKELLLVMQKEATPSVPTVHCVNLSGKVVYEPFVFTSQEETQAICPYADSPKTYLYEPNASILKAQAYRTLAARMNLHKLHPNSHLYTSEIFIKDFPGRSFCVEGYCNFSKKELKSFLQDVPKANLTVRNFPAQVAELRKRLRLAEGGETYLFATTLANEQHVLVRCKKATEAIK